LSSALENENNLQFCEICGNIKSYDKKFFFTPLLLLFLDPGSGIRDPGSGMGKNQDPRSGIRDKHPGSATLLARLVARLPVTASPLDSNPDTLQKS
jgi:hypothetical protein